MVDKKSLDIAVLSDNLLLLKSRSDLAFYLLGFVFPVLIPQNSPQLLSSRTVPLDALFTQILTLPAPDQFGQSPC